MLIAHKFQKLRIIGVGFQSAEGSVFWTFVIQIQSRNCGNNGYDPSDVGGFFGDNWENAIKTKQRNVYDQGGKDECGEIDPHFHWTRCQCPFDTVVVYIMIIAFWTPIDGRADSN